MNTNQRENVKIIGTMTIGLIAGTVPGLGLFLLLSSVPMNLAPEQKLVMYAIAIALFGIGLLLGAIFGIVCCIFNRLNHTVNPNQTEL